MHLSILLTTYAYATTASGIITWTLSKPTSPTPDQSTAYTLISTAMKAAVARHTRLNPSTSKTINVYYNTGVPTAEGNYDGTISFGSNRAYMTERTALHEIGHTLGIGQTQAFTDKCAANNWPEATRLLEEWDGSSAKIMCGGGHFWPYGLNYETEWSESNGDRNVEIIDAMIVDGLQAY